MTSLVIVTLILLIALLGVYVVIENNRKKAREAEKRAFNERVKEINAHFKNKLNELVETEVVHPKFLPKLQAIASNFFVVQHHTEENLEQLEKVTDLFTSAVSTELQKCHATGNYVQLQTQIQYFIAELPSSGIGFNKAFYREILPALILLIQTNNEPNAIDELNIGADLPEQPEEKEEPSKKDDNDFTPPMTKAQELSSY
ncbi:putative orphan protein [Pseudoalteromonas luteoviolacea B = ATCC 29581]|nr:putative orphan protein [Pseudoalteromonas luteoviolacea B = ATCC 29581]